jgi:hypothetical protein
MDAIVRVIGVIVVGMILLSFTTLWIIEMLDRVSTLGEYAPWLVALAEHKKWHAVVLLACWIFLCFAGVELYFKEIPEVPKPPVLKFVPPVPPAITIVEVAPPMKAQCWVRNYAVPALAPPPMWGMATIFCNRTIKPPYSIELEYDQNNVLLGVVTYPVGGEFSRGATFNRGSKIVDMEELHTIIPNEPFSVMVRGSSDKFPLVKTAIIRAKNLALEFHP